ncbi:hypothetical protein BDL97_08G133800 [Sphagnum fallax]|nr:hypothetical protein BDL97_08G133800 [Sphagnum fallax]
MRYLTRFLMQNYVKLCVCLLRMRCWMQVPEPAGECWGCVVGAAIVLGSCTLAHHTMSQQSNQVITTTCEPMINASEKLTGLMGGELQSCIGTRS